MARNVAQVANLGLELKRCLEAVVYHFYGVVLGNHCAKFFLVDRGHFYLQSLEGVQTNAHSVVPAAAHKHHPLEVFEHAFGVNLGDFPLPETVNLLLSLIDNNYLVTLLNKKVRILLNTDLHKAHVQILGVAHPLQVKLLVAHDCVSVEQLVELAKLEEEDLRKVALLELPVLALDRRHLGKLVRRNVQRVRVVQAPVDRFVPIDVLNELGLYEPRESLVVLRLRGNQVYLGLLQLRLSHLGVYVDLRFNLLRGHVCGHRLRSRLLLTWSPGFGAAEEL